MDEAKEKGGSVATVSESSVTVSETVVETMVCEHQLQVEEGGEAGHSNGDDIMVEVLGSHVYVDGICTTDGGDGGAVGAGSNDEAVHGRDESGEDSLEGNLRSLDSEGDAAGDLGSRSEVSGGQAVAQNEGNGSGVEGSHALGSSVGGEASETAELNSGTNEGPGDYNQDLETQKVGVQLSHGNQETVAFSTASEDSSVQTQVVEGAAMTDGDLKTQVIAEDVLHSEAKDSVYSFQSPELVVEGQLDEKVNSSMEIDKQGADSEQHQMEVNTSCLSTENLTTGNDQSLKVETVIDRGDDADLSKGESMDVERKVSNDENVCLRVEQDVEDQEEPVKDEAMGVGPENVDNNVSNQTSPSVASDKVLHSSGNEDQLAKNAPSEDDSCVGEDSNVEEQVTGEEQDGLDKVQEMEVEEHDTDSEQPINIDEKSVKRTALKSVSSLKEHQAKYQIWSEQESEFSVSDLVWGKVRSHPWWPGQIFDPSDASEKAVKYHKKDSFLVAYFGDRTFAWNEASVLKPFRTQFCQIEKQSSSESFQNAVNCALEEVSRRVELGLACSCTPQDAYDKIKVQKVENAGVRQESSIRDGVDMSLSASSFEPDKLVDYMKALAESPSGGSDRLDLVIAKAQLLAFHRFKGCHQLPELQLCGGLSENEANMLHSDEKMHYSDVIEHGSPMDTDGEQISTGLETSKTERSSYLKRKHNLKDVLYPSKKERSLSELMVETCDSPDGENGFDGIANKLTSPTSGKKRKAVDSFEDSDSLAKVSPTTTNIPKPSFKIGECIRRAASQMTGSPSILKSSGDRLQKPGGGGENTAAEGYDVPVDTFEDAQQKMNVTTEYSSPDELVSVVREQLPGDKAGGKRKKLPTSIMGSPETFEFDDMNDTYWTDRIVQNGSEEQPSHDNGRAQYQIVPVDLGKPVQKGRKSRKRYSEVNHDLVAQKPSGYVDERAPAELVMNFSEINSVPSETKLNKMFKHFGPLKESETEVDRETSRARVVFRRTSDAEVAYNSAGKFNIFGPVVVNYQLNYTISESFIASLYAPTLAEETPLMDSTHLCGNHDHALVSNLGEENSLIAPSLGEEASFIVSTLGEETLPIDTTFHAFPTTLGDGSSVIATTMYMETMPIPTTLYEETMPIATTMYEETMPISTTMYEETMTISTTMYEETLPIATTAGEGTMAVVTTIGDQTFMTTSTAGEQPSTIVTTVSEQTSTVDSTLVEEASLFTTTLSNETSNITNFGDETFSVASLAQETSTIPTISGEETPSIPSNSVEETPSIPSNSVEETPSIPTNSVEETPSIPTTLETPTNPVTLAEESSTLGKEIPNPLTNVGEETPVIPATFSEETVTIPGTLGQETTTIPATLGEETTAIPATMGKETTTGPAILQEETLVEESPTITTTLGEENPVNPTTSGEKIPTNPTILGMESLIIPTTLGSEASTVPTTLAEETTTVPAILQEEAFAEETPTITTTLGEETPVNTTTSGEEIPTNPTTLGNESSIIPITLGSETSTVPTTLAEETPVPTTDGEEASTISTTMETETLPPSVAESKESAT